MSIKQQQLGGERNILVDDEKVKDVSFLCDLSTIASAYLEKELCSILESVEIYYNTGHTLCVTIDDSNENIIYETKFYPLDIPINQSEFSELMNITSLEDIKGKFKRTLHTHVNNVQVELDKVRSAHPESPLRIDFSPADTLFTVGTFATTGAAFIAEHGDKLILETEMHFLISPTDEASNVY